MNRIFVYLKNNWRAILSGRWAILIYVVLAILAVIGGVKGYQVNQMIQGFKNQPAPVATVSTTKAELQDWNQSTLAVGTLRAVRGADLSFETAGIVDAIDFKSGDTAHEGQLLVQLRAADEVAHLDSLKASADLAQTSYKRDQAQFEAQAVSQATLDSDAANLRSLQAQVLEQQAVVDKKSLHAPFAGQLGVRWVDDGQYVEAGTKIVTLQQLDPIDVDFFLPQQALAELGVGQKLTITADTFPDLSFDGTVSAIDPKVDADTRNVRVRGSLHNPQHKLLPGMFARVTVETGAPQHYLTLPSTAIAYNPYGATVFIVEPKNDKDNKTPGTKPQLVTRQVFVTTGPTRGDQVAILKGLKEGDEVVTTGQIKLRNGTAVAINNAVQPANDANPTPQEH
jgi:membrane fusion protein (multidrug efflux system)